jgi:hypothetical protein
MSLPHAVSSIDKLCDCESGRSSEGEEEGDKREPEPVMSFTKVSTANHSFTCKE